MNEVATRHTVESLFALKLKMLGEFRTLFAAEKTLFDQFHSFGGHSPIRVEFHFKHYSQDREERAIDQYMWRYLVRMYSLEKYMLCTDWDKMLKEIEECRTPDFTVDNANGWLKGLKDLIQENVKTLVKKVYAGIVNGTYYVGTGYNADKKKRNNNGVDSYFILRTSDYQSIFSYWRDGPSIMDDLEKVCYLLDGKSLPDKTLRMVLKAGKLSEAENEYMSVKLCQNGNTHFKLSDETRNRLNRYGPDGAVIGEDIKIKVFDSRETYQ